MKIHRRLISLLLLLWITGRIALAQTAVEQHGRLQAANANIWDNHGKPARLRGISFSWSVWGGKKYYTPEVVRWLKEDFKVNVIRLSMAVEPEGGYLQKPAEQERLIMTVLDEAIAQGIYVLMDWHDHHADKNIEAAKRFFQTIAQRYAGVPNVIYEIWNEPERVSWRTVKRYAEQLIPVIRQFDAQNLIVVGSPNWDQDVDIVATDPITGDPNLAYSFHFYASDAYHQQALRDKAEKALQLGLPLMVTEWGVGEADGDGVFDQGKTAAWLAWMEKRQLSWVNWNITDKRETTALLQEDASVSGNWSLDDLTPAGQYIRTQLRLLHADPLKGLKRKPLALIDARATSQTQALYRNLDSLSQNHILFGHQAATAYGHGWNGDPDRSDVKMVSGSHPAVIGADFSGLSGMPAAAIAENKAGLLKQVIDTYNRGGMVTMAWHFQNPVSQDGFYWQDSTSTAAMCLIKPGGKQHEHYKAILRELADFAHAAKGQDGHLVPLIFRPFHEFDGDWFWWGKAHTSREDFISVWRFTVSYLRDSLQVHNFIYAFSPDCRFETEKEYLERYPGDHWVDMVGIDDYADFGRDGYYDVVAGLKKLRIVSGYAQKAGKLAAFTETGLESIPHRQWWTEVLLRTLKKEKLKLAYVLVWRNDEKSQTHFYAPYPGHPSVPDFLSFYKDPYTLFENDLPPLYR